jgi:hypothetical protein
VVTELSTNTRRLFRENKIDAAVLPKLTVEDLRDLGVAAVGDRRMLLEATECLRAGTKFEPTSSEASSTAADWLGFSQPSAVILEMMIW